MFKSVGTGATLAISSANSNVQYIDRTTCVKLPVNNLNCYAYAPLTNAATDTFDTTAANQQFPL